LLRPHLNITYDDLLAVAELMKSFPAPWYVSGGWAIDALAGRATRKHEDLEIGIARRDQGLLHPHLPGRQLYKILPRAEGAEIVAWEQGDRLELPVFQIIVQQEGSSPPQFEFFLNDVSDGEWQFRRDPSIRRPAAEICLQTDDGIPVLAPEIQLLYKAKWHRSKDEHDFRTALGFLDPAQRTWLREALEIHQPNDPWIAELERGG
jgi:hypothetical protein